MDYIISEKKGTVERTVKGQKVDVPTLARSILRIEGDVPTIAETDKATGSTLRKGYTDATQGANKKRSAEDYWKPIGGGAWTALRSTLAGAFRSYPHLAVASIDKATVDGVEITTTVYVPSGQTRDVIPASYLRAFLRRNGRPSYRAAFPKEDRSKVDGLDASAGLSTVLLGADPETGRASIDTGLDAKSVGIYLARNGLRVGSAKKTGGKGQRLFTPSPRDSFGLSRMAGLAPYLIGGSPEEDWSRAARYEDAITSALIIRGDVKDAGKHDGIAVERAHDRIGGDRDKVWTLGKKPPRLESNPDKEKRPKAVKAPKRRKAPGKGQDKDKGEKAA